MENSYIFQSQSPQDTLRLARRIGSQLAGGRMILLTGSLGSGKSVVARGIAQAVGVSTWRGSPTFALVHEYDTLPPLYHIDLYRISSLEVDELGIEELSREGGIIIVEWADRAEAYLRTISDQEPVTIDMRITGPSQREIDVGGFQPESCGEAVSERTT